MSEEQADTDDTQPTPGPWTVYDPHNDAPFINSGPHPSNICRLMFSPHWGDDEVWANARLTAAAGTAASELPEEYDPVAVVEALPLLITALEMMSRADTFSREGLIMAQNHARDVLNAARKDTTQTDE